MFETLKSVFRVKEMRTKTSLRLMDDLCHPYRFTASRFRVWTVMYSNSGFRSNTGDAFNFFDAFTGGSFESMSVFALNITPYITSSIIIQLLTIAIPALEEMHRDGEEGRKKMTAITRYVTIGLALFESIAMTIGFSPRKYRTGYEHS